MSKMSKINILKFLTCPRSFCTCKTKFIKLKMTTSLDIKAILKKINIKKKLIVPDWIVSESMNFIAVLF